MVLLPRDPPLSRLCPTLSSPPRSAVRSVRPLSSNVEFPFPVPCFFPVFLDFSPQSVGPAGGGRGRLCGPHQSPPRCPLLHVWTVGARFPCPFFLFLRRLLRVPAHPLRFVSRFGPGPGSAAPAPRRPRERGRPPARSVRPPCWRIVCHLNLHPPTPG